MTNIYWEIVFIIVGIIVCLRFLRQLEIKNTRLFKIYQFFYVLSLIVCFIIVEFSQRGSMLFGDGYDYYLLAQKVIDLNGFNLITMLDMQLFFNVSQSWHMIPIWEFAFFIGMFKSTKCLALFHVVLTNLCSIIWLKFFQRIKMENSGLIAATLLVISLYIRNFTVPALKDALVYFLFTICVFFLQDFYLYSKYKDLLKLIIPLVVLLFTRMYLAVALMVSLCIFVFIDFIKIDKQRISIIRFFSVVVLVSAFFLGIVYISKTAIFEYANLWIDKLEINLSLFLDVIWRLFNFIYGPFFLNIWEAQSLYYPSYIAAFIRLLLTPALIVGLNKLFRHEQRYCLYILLVIPMIICMVALNVGESESPIRQYMNFYPILCILYGLAFEREAKTFEGDII